MTYPKLFEGDCIDLLKGEEFTGLIDLILTDLPYGTTNNPWDEIIPFDDMWESFHRVLRPKGIIVLTAVQPFAAKLIMSNPSEFRCEWIWEKTIGSGQLNIDYHPLKAHESVLMFSKQTGGTYNPQMGTGKPYHAKRNITKKDGYGGQRPHESENLGTRYPTSVIKISNPRIKGGHPTQKPVALMEYLIRTYSNEGDVVLDCCMGSGTTGVASVIQKRKFIGIEKDPEYFNGALERINKAHLQQSFFEHDPMERFFSK